VSRADVLVLGGGLAGCFAAISAAFDAEIKPGIEVIVLEDASMNDKKYVDNILSLFDKMVK
jgi:succinate dehydrogenase/fumarate reductase flavoprotein subunit